MSNKKTVLRRRGRGRAEKKPDVKTISNHNNIIPPPLCLLRRPEVIKKPNDFGLVRVERSPNYHFGKLYYTPGEHDKIYIRTDRLTKPIGGKTGTIIKLNLNTMKIERAWFAGWHEWIDLRDSKAMRQIEAIDYCEIEPEVLARALGVQI